jgi:hypothetical protein
MAVDPVEFVSTIIYTEGTLLGELALESDPCCCLFDCEHA